MHHGRRHRRYGDHRRPRIPGRNVDRGRAARYDRHSADLRRYQPLLGEGGARRHHSCRGSVRLSARARPPGQAGRRMTRALLGLLAIEIAVFSFTGTNFWSVANAFEIVRLGAELGLLALALTPVLLTGGIDLSVGSMMGL